MWDFHSFHVFIENIVFCEKSAGCTYTNAILYKLISFFIWFYIFFWFRSCFTNCECSVSIWQPSNEMIQWHFHMEQKNENKLWHLSKNIIHTDIFFQQTENWFFLSNLRYWMKNIAGKRKITIQLSLFYIYKEIFIQSHGISFALIFICFIQVKPNLNENREDIVYKLFIKQWQCLLKEKSLMSYQKVGES